MALEGGQISNIVNFIALACVLAVLVRHNILPHKNRVNLATADNDAIESKQNDRCLSIDSGLSELIDSTNQVFMLKSPRVPGSSVKAFSDECRDEFPELAFQYPELSEHLLADYETPKILASHFLSPDHLINHIETTTKDTLTIYVHRPETSRIHSAIKFLLSNRGCRCVASGLCQQGTREQSPVTFEKVDGLDCYVNEDHVLELSKLKQNEIGGSGEKLLTCDTYDAIQRYGPNLVFMDYKKVTNLSDVLAGRYCPELVGNNYNPRRNKEQERHRVFVTTNSTHSVPVEEWLKTKSRLLESALGLDEKAPFTCRAKTKKWEEMLNSCEDGFLNVKGLDF
mmetsp:Transcript_4907/g.10759  ORF Transcript_4907/g.10759 Transcript_4907/m.10759 type:complete len:340 (+) Transcript_4907:146-1165(+)